MALRALGRRVGKLERVTQPSLSPLVLWFGSVDAFENNVVQPGIESGLLCPADMPEIADAMRQWVEQGHYAAWKLDRIWKR